MQRVMNVLAVPLLLVVGFVIFLVTKTLVGAEDAKEVAPTPRDSVSATELAPGDVSSSGLPPPECGEVAATDAYGYPLGRVESLVRGIHEAACRRDYSGFLPYMEETFNEWFPKGEVVAEWAQEDSDGFMLQTLVETLETRAVGDQGGQYFCHPNGAVVVFARGTHDQPGMWSSFDLTGQERPTACEAVG